VELAGAGLEPRARKVERRPLDLAEPENARVEAARAIDVRDRKTHVVEGLDVH
jgi:hypothetical protein